MKKILLLIALSVSAFAFMSGPFSAPTTGNLIPPTHEYEIDTWGANSEVYEFTPRSNTGYTCVMLMLDNSKAMGLQCFPKPQFMKEVK